MCVLQCCSYSSFLKIYCPHRPWARRLCLFSYLNDPSHAVLNPDIKTKLVQLLVEYSGFYVQTRWIMTSLVMQFQRRFCKMFWEQNSLKLSLGSGVVVLRNECHFCWTILVFWHSKVSFSESPTFSFFYVIFFFIRIVFGFRCLSRNFVELWSWLF